MSTDIHLDSIRRPLPAPDPDSKPFWDGCAEHKLLVQHCSDCNTARFPPLPLCHRCRSWDFEWVETTRGYLRSWVVIDKAVIGMLGDQIPYTVGLVDVGDGSNMPCNIIGADPDDLTVDMAVTVVFQATEGGPSLPAFTPEEV
jgi:uncharacterized OB-fold protein